jgi:hypothetical protein
MKNLILKLSLILTILSGNLFMLAPAYAIDCSSPKNSKEEIQCGTCQANGTTANCDPSGSSGTLSDTIKTVINVLSVFGGALAVVFIIIGGFRYIVSSGNPEQAKGARNTILYALVGLVIIATAQIVVHFVINGVKDCANGKTSSGQAC